MDLVDLEQGLKAVSSGGSLLNVQELTSLQVALTLLRAKEKYPAIYFWGKIAGLKADYYIAYGLKDAEFEFPVKAFYFAGEDFEFRPLPQISEEAAAYPFGDKPFTGLPDAIAVAPVVAEEPADDADPDAPAAPKGPTFTELERLVQVVLEIDADTSVVPKGAHALNEAHVVVPAADFQGLGLTEATSLSKYAHFRQPRSIAALRVLARTDAVFYSNFLDPLEGDVPKGCWAVRQDPSATLVTLRSLTWQGYCAYHIAGTPKFGGVYYGQGAKSRDLPFML